MLSKLRRHPSFWDLTASSNPSFVTPNEEVFSANASQSQSVDVCVVGAGITGLTTAYALTQAGKDVLVLEAEAIGAGTTGGTSAHLDPLTDAYLYDLMKSYGEDTTRKIVQAGKQSIRFIETVCKKHAINCDFKRVPGIYFTDRQSNIDKLKKELEAAQELGLEPELLYQSPIPFTCYAALRFNIQAEFHPVKYLHGLAGAIHEKGGKICEQVRVLSTKTGKNGIEVQTPYGIIHAKRVVLATHIPIGIALSLQTRSFPYRSYVLGIRLNQPVPDGLYWDLEDPYHYMRKAKDTQGELLILGGADHHTGESVDTEQSYHVLERYARRHFDVKSIDYEWSSQYYEPADMLPYIGEEAMGKDIYIGTGYSGNGLTYGTLAGCIIADQIMGNTHSLGELFSPSRINPIRSVKKFASENFCVFQHFVGDRLAKAEVRNVNEIAAGEGNIVEIEGKKVAAYRDYSGSIHLMSPACTHAGCYVHWNNSEATWDCPCHGGRFAATGERLIGPPTQDLHHYSYEEFGKKPQKKSPKSDVA